MTVKSFCRSRIYVLCPNDMLSKELNMLTYRDDIDQQQRLIILYKMSKNKTNYVACWNPLFVNAFEHLPL